MPWGKHRGKELSECPISYLMWVLEECDITYFFRQECVRQIQSWVDEQGGASVAPAPGHSERELKNSLQTWYRLLCRDFHPDRGGDTRVMMVINEAYERLQKQLGLFP